jgi:serine/threonine protein kinase
MAPCTQSLHHASCAGRHGDAAIAITILQLSSCTSSDLAAAACAGGELFERVAGSGPLREADARRWFLQLVDGLAHCHARGVFHRRAAPTPQSRPTQCKDSVVLQAAVAILLLVADTSVVRLKQTVHGLTCRDLKLENILLTADGDVKLSDFGLGAVREAAAESHLLHTVRCFSPRTPAAPEHRWATHPQCQGGPGDQSSDP